MQHPREKWTVNGYENKLLIEYRKRVKRKKGKLNFTKLTKLFVMFCFSCKSTCNAERRSIFPLV
jgi:hypothetical protein